MIAFSLDALRDVNFETAQHIGFVIAVTIAGVAALMARPKE